ncbi:MAG: carbohydrate ABC transporter permease [Lachnospiraceae bacterium]|nr:carbohydrate ABC transporter permease [Lachnospiraceae bacterium]
MSRSTKRILKIIVEIVSIIIGLIYLSPVLLLILNVFKPLGEILVNPFSLPKNLYLDNIEYVFGTMNYARSLCNTVLISVIVVVICIVLSAMTGWMLQRDGSRLSGIITILLLSSMLVPFQSFMIPLAKLAASMGLGDSIGGYVWIQVTLYAPMGIFMYEGFVKSVPKSLEESARLDGGSTLQVFFRIVFPLLKPITSSIMVLYSLWIWNDYVLASIILKSETKKTVTLSVYSFFSMYLNRWDYAITAVAFSVAPITILYILLQKHVINGVTAGAVKG